MSAGWKIADPSDFPALLNFQTTLSSIAPTTTQTPIKNRAIVPTTTDASTSSLSNKYKPAIVEIACSHFPGCC